MNKKENLLRKANEMKQRGKLKEAIPEYRRAIEQAPNCSWSHFFLGEALAESGDWVNAVSSLRQAAKLNSTSKVIQEKLNFGLTNLEKNAKKYAHQGLELEHQGDYETAIEYYQKALDSEVNQELFVYYNLGKLLLAKGKQDFAEKIFDCLEKRFPNHPHGLEGLALVAQERKDWELAVERWNRCISISKAYLKTSNNFPKKVKDQELSRLQEAYLQRNYCDFNYLEKNSIKITFLSKADINEKIKLADANIELISVHIAKTAGTAFREVLLNAYSPDQIFWHYLVPGSYKNLGDINVNKSVSVLHGHLYINQHANFKFFNSAKKIVWLRDPILRTISHYFYMFTILDDDGLAVMQSPVWMDMRINRNMTLLDFARYKNMSNLMSKTTQISLSDYDFVGIQEFYEDDIKDLQLMMGWPEYKVNRANDNRYPEYQKKIQDILNDEKVIDELKLINSLDVELYETALELRKKRKQESGFFQK